MANDGWLVLALVYYFCPSDEVCGCFLDEGKQGAAFFVSVIRSFLLTFYIIF